VPLADTSRLPGTKVSPCWEITSSAAASVALARVVLVELLSQAWLAAVAAVFASSLELTWARPIERPSNPTRQDHRHDQGYDREPQPRAVDRYSKSSVTSTVSSADSVPSLRFAVASGPLG
jgi:hypothetical protein